MPKGPRIIAVLILLGWLFAAGHVALEHGGRADGGVAHAQAAAGHDDDHDESGPAHDGDHHHDLVGLTGGQFTKTAEQRVLAPVWVPLYGALMEELTTVLREAVTSRGNFDFGCAPPDARASGWLLVLQTARPVRGPSLV
jgi:hypothetical protein